MFVQFTCWKISKTVTVKLLLPIDHNVCHEGNNQIPTVTIQLSKRSATSSGTVKNGTTANDRNAPSLNSRLTSSLAQTVGKHETINVADMNPAELKVVGNVKYSFGSRT